MNFMVYINEIVTLASGVFSEVMNDIILLLIGTIDMKEL